MTQQYTFTKSYRLLSPAQFKGVFDKTDKKIHQSHLMAFVKKNDLDNPRLGLAITKKKVPTAVARNKIKRLTRENFRLQTDKLPNVDVVFIVKRPVNELDNAELTQQIQTIFKKIQRLSFA